MWKYGDMECGDTEIAKGYKIITPLFPLQYINVYNMHLNDSHHLYVKEEITI